jgi:hypothetical protein
MPPYNSTPFPLIAHIYIKPKKSYVRATASHRQRTLRALVAWEANVLIDHHTKTVVIKASVRPPQVNIFERGAGAGRREVRQVRRDKTYYWFSAYRNSMFRGLFITWMNTGVYVVIQ